MARSTAFTPAERSLIGGAAAIVFTRVFAFSLVLAGFTDYARGLAHPSSLGPGAVATLVGVAFGAYGLTMALAQLGNGILSDRVGRKPILVVGTVLFVLGSIWAAYAGSLAAMILARLVQGLGGVSSTAMAAVGETVPEERRTTAMAIVGIPAGIGFFLGFLMGPLLQPSLGMRGLFLVVALLGAVATLPILLRPVPAPRANLAQPGDRRSLSLPVLALASAGFTINFAMMAVTFDFTAFLHRFGHTGDLTLAGVLVAAFAIMGGASRAVDRSRTSWQPIVLCLAALLVGAPLFREADRVSLLAVGGVAFFAAHSVLSAVLPSQVSRLAGRSGGRGHGIQLVVAYLGTFAGGATVGWFSGTPHPAGVFLVLAAVAALAAALVVTALRPLTQVSPRTLEADA